MGTNTPIPQLLTEKGSALGGELVPQGVQASAGSRQLSKLKRTDGSKLPLSVDELITSHSMRRDEFGIGYHSGNTKHRLLGGDQLLQWEAAIVSSSESDEELSAAAAAQAEDSEEGWCSFENMVASRVRSGRGKPTVVSNSEGDEELDEEDEQEADECAQKIKRRRLRLGSGSKEESTS